MSAPVQAREAAIAALGAGEFDVLVIGGGITGAGVAVDAAARGLRTAIVDKGDWASGTSSKSSKLVHGGLRYLSQKDYRLVYEALHERHRLLRNAPHLVHVIPFLIPVFGKDGVVSASIAKAYTTALTLYDVTGGWRIGKWHKRISKEETLRHMGGLSKARVAAGFLYYDAQADDARLTLALVRTAMDHGAVAVNHLGVRELLSTNGKLDRAVLTDGTIVRARTIINAGGVWGAEIMGLGGVVDAGLRPAKGIHVTVPLAKVGADIAAVVPVPKDRRSVFVVPSFDGTERIHIGTTDTDYDGPLDDPQCTAADVQYILDGMNAWLEEPLTTDDVLGTWAGLRPLLQAAKSERTADLSRRHAVITSSNGLVSVLGGKLTTYREMAEDAVDAVMKARGEKRRGRTKRLDLHGAGGYRALDLDGLARSHGLSREVVEHVARRHGGETPQVLALANGDTSLLQPLVAGLPYLRVEVVWAARHEQAIDVADVLERRTRAVLHDRSGAEAATDDVAALLAAELGWSDERRGAEAAAFRARLQAERDAAAA